MTLMTRTAASLAAATCLLASGLALAQSDPVLTYAITIEGSFTYELEPHPILNVGDEFRYETVVTNENLSIDSEGSFKVLSIISAQMFVRPVGGTDFVTFDTAGQMIPRMLPEFQGDVGLQPGLFDLFPSVVEANAFITGGFELPSAGIVGETAEFTDLLAFDGLNSRLVLTLDTFGRDWMGGPATLSVVDITPDDPDTDGDGITDADEVDLYGTNPELADSDGDGLDDPVELFDILCGPMGDQRPDPTNPDSDGDGLSDGYEVNVVNSDACNPDSDGDGLIDGIDPTPTVSGAPAAFIEAATRSLSDSVGSLDLSLFNGPNDKANKGRRNSLSTRIRNAANKLADGDEADAIDLLAGVLDKVQGDDPQWMNAGSEQGNLEGQLVLLIALIVMP